LPARARRKPSVLRGHNKVLTEGTARLAAAWNGQGKRPGQARQFFAETYLGLKFQVQQ